MSKNKSTFFDPVDPEKLERARRIIQKEIDDGFNIGGLNKDDLEDVAVNLKQWMRVLREKTSSKQDPFEQPELRLLLQRMKRH